MNIDFLCKTVGMLNILVVLYFLMFRQSRFYAATLWSDGLYCHEWKSWYYAAWMAPKVTVCNVIVRQHHLLSKRTVLVFEKTDHGLVMLGVARRIPLYPHHYYHHTETLHA